MKSELTLEKRKPSFMKNDVLWNGIGSMTYALASMVLAFFVLRLGGEEQGGVFGFGYSTLGQQFFIIAYFGLRPFQITDMKGEFSFREYRQYRYITGGLALFFALGFLFFQFALGFYSGEKSSILFFLCLFRMPTVMCMSRNCKEEDFCIREDSLCSFVLFFPYFRFFLYWLFLRIFFLRSLV